MYTWLHLESSTDLEALLRELGPEFGADQVVARLQDGLSSSVRAILIERDYIDKDYRSTYYSFYAKKGQSYRKDCVRLHLFEAGSVRLINVQIPEPRRILRVGLDRNLLAALF